MGLFHNREADNDKLDLFAAHLSSIEPEEGQLSVDVYQDGSRLVVKSTIAGAKPEDIEITLADDALTIKGKREMDQYIDHKDYLYRECYWGRFARTIILPFAVDENKIEVSLERGVLTVVLVKAQQNQPIRLSPKK